MLTVFVRTLILYGVSVVAIRLMGKRQVGQLQPYEFVVALMIAELAASPMENVGTPLLYGMTEYVGRSYSERSTNYGYGGRTSTNVVIKPKKSKDSMIVPASGHVLLAEDLGGSYGYTVVIDHGAGLRSIFYGLTALDVEAGDDVKQGQLLGTSGRTVVAELRIGTVPINPLLVWRGQCDGLKYY